VVIALAVEGVNRRKQMLSALTEKTSVIKLAGVELPPCQATVVEVDFKSQKIRFPDWALAALAVLANQNHVLSLPMLNEALTLRFKKDVFDAATSIVNKIAAA
jgi:hypothetical protein